MTAELVEIAGLFLKLGAIGFGGPAAHIAVMQREVVQKRNWLTQEEFLDLLGATNLIPGPNSTEMAIYIGYLRGGFLGLLVAGVSFILPAAAITALIAYLYVQFGSLPQAAPILRGITPAILMIIVAALVRLTGAAIKSWPLAVVMAAVAAAAFVGADQVLALLAGGLLGAILLRLLRGKTAAASFAAMAGAWGGSTAAASLVSTAPAAAPPAVAFSLGKLALFFLKVGAVLYGGGYVLIAYLDGDLVREYGWLTERQLLDAIAVGQFTPGPLLSTATFVGYVLAGPAGAAVATVSIFLPSFLFVLAVNPLVPRLRRSRWASLVLDAVNAGSIGLMAVAAVMLARSSLIDYRAWLIAAVSAAVLFRWRPAPAWLVLGGAIAGWVLYGTG